MPTRWWGQRTGLWETGVKRKNKDPRTAPQWAVGSGARMCVGGQLKSQVHVASSMGEKILEADYR